ncbi:MAG TPA: hypothetical protein ENI99_02875 [Sedimenticola sp.]|nr:hypothetical protein [Sedimenticola sp.]
MLSLFNNKSLLDEDATQWLFDAYAWALGNFGSDFFHEETILVTPTSRHFPCRVNSRESMAASVFEQVAGYAGMQNWPFRLVEPGPDFVPVSPSSITFNGAPRGPAASLSLDGEVKDLTITYTPEQTRDPSVLAALFSLNLAAHLGRATDEPPPGDEELRGHATDLLAIFMGFGLFLANNAVMVRSGCSGCGRSVQSMGFLSEDEMTYGLALFCVLKEIPNQEALPHLKRPLRPLFKKAVKEISANRAGVGRLLAIDRPIKSIPDVS